MKIDILVKFIILLSQTALVGSLHDVWHFGGSHIGSHIAGQTGLVHFQLH